MEANLVCAGRPAVGQFLLYPGFLYWMASKMVANIKIVIPNYYY